MNQQGKPLPLKLKRQTGEYIESQFTEAEIYEQKLPWEQVPG